MGPASSLPNMFLSSGLIEFEMDSLPRSKHLSLVEYLQIGKNLHFENKTVPVQGCGIVYRRGDLWCFYHSPVRRQPRHLFYSLSFFSGDPIWLFHPFLIFPNVVHGKADGWDDECLLSMLTLIFLPLIPSSPSSRFSFLSFFPLSVSRNLLDTFFFFLYYIEIIHNHNNTQHTPFLKSQISRSDLDPSYFHEKYYIAAAASSIEWVGRRRRVKRCYSR